MKRCLKRVVRVAGLAVVAVVTVGAVFIVGMRTKHPKVLRAVRYFNREVFNPDQMKTAGTPGAFASIVEHVGRTSGTEYRTPVGVTPTDDGVAIALPFGVRADWLKNVLAAGSATIVHEGETFGVDSPEVVPIDEAAECFSEQARHVHELLDVEHVLRVHRTGS